MNDRAMVAATLAKNNPFPDDDTITKEYWAKNLLDLADAILDAENETRTRAEVSEEDRTTYTRAVDKVLEIYNEVFARKVGLSTNRIKNIVACIKEGKKYGSPVKPSDFKKVFEYKKAQWWEDDEKKSWCSLETLTGKKFTKYLEQARVVENTGSEKGPKAVKD